MLSFTFIFICMYGIGLLMFSTTVIIVHRSELVLGLFSAILSHYQYDLLN